MCLNKFIHQSKKRDNTLVLWDNKAKKAFEQCKLSLQSVVTLSHHTHSGVPIILMCDASDNCVGAVLQQRVNNRWESLGYFSKKLTEA